MPTKIAICFGSGITCGCPVQLDVNAGQPKQSNTLGVNKDGREKDADARRWRRGIVYRRRRGINSFPVAIRLVHRPSPVHSPVMLIPRSSLLVTALVMFSPIFVIFGESRRHVYAADHCSQDKPHHNLARNGSEIP